MQMNIHASKNPFTTYHRKQSMKMRKEEEGGGWYDEPKSNHMEMYFMDDFLQDDRLICSNHIPSESIFFPWVEQSEGAAAIKMK